MKDLSIKVSDSEIESTLQELEYLGMVNKYKDFREWGELIFISGSMYIVVYGDRTVSLHNHNGGNEVISLEEFKIRLRYEQDNSEG